MSEFRSAPDLTVPAELISELESMAGGMDQQAQASRATSGMGGHPYPEVLYARVAATLRAAASYVKLKEQPPAPAPTPPPPAESPAEGAPKRRS